MTYTVLIAGSGGQGILMAGRLLAEGAMDNGSFVTWFPQYGAAKRGGHVNCTVIISDRPIGSPVSTTLDALVALDERSLLDFESRLISGGILVMDSSNIKVRPVRDDIEVISIPVRKLGGEAATARLANIVLLGALVSCPGPVRPEHAVAAMRRIEIRDLESNISAFRLGRERGLDKKSQDI